MRELPQLATLRPLLIGVSRKSMIAKVLHSDAMDDRYWPTIALTAHAREHGARIVRVHDVKPNREALRMMEAILAQTLDQWPDGVEPLFLVWSEIELPPVRNWLFDNEGRVFQSEGNRGPLSDGCFVLEGKDEEYHWHYREQDLARIGDFDIAYTYERHGGKEPCYRLVVVSQRFRRVMEELGFKKFRYGPHCVDEEPWSGGVDGPVHPRLSGPPPASPKPPC
jgi:hypothetical protein